MGKKILLVDDDELIRLTFEEYLSDEGHDVYTGQSGEEAIEILDKDCSFDLVITDLRMYGESGVDVFKKVLETNSSIPVMIMTGFGSGSSLFKEAMELKPCCFTMKPSSKDAFLEKIRIWSDKSD